jgi:polar amino acid transport system permease protein
MSGVTPVRGGESSPGADEVGRPVLLRRHVPALSGWRGVAASTVTTLLLVGLIVWELVSPRSAVFRQFFLNFRQMKLAIKGDHNLGIVSVLRAFWLNIWLSVVCEACVLALALLVAIVRLTTGPILRPFRGLLIVYADFARGVPLILLMLWAGLGLPSLYIRPISYQSPVVYAGFVLVFTYTAYVSEVVRAGILSVPQAQVQAARSLGLKSGQAMRHVIVPQAVRNVLPALLNDFISLQKDTAIVLILGIIEVTNAAQIDAGAEFNFSPYAVAAALFLIITVPLTRLTDQMIARDRGRRLAGLSVR